MRNLVCIKQVPETAEVKIDPESHTLMREGIAAIVNPLDSYALEEGLRLREKYGKKVTVLTMGPPQAEQALREAIAMGVDEAILVTDRVAAGSDTLATSYTLGKAVEKHGPFDLVICGKQAIDGDTAQVGPELAEVLGLPFVAYVRKIEEVKDAILRVQRLMEDGYEVIEAPLPAVISVVKEINEPRLPSLRGMLRAKKAEIVREDAASLGADPGRIGREGSPTRVIETFTPPRRTQGKLLEGEPAEQANALLEAFGDLNIL